MNRTLTGRIILSQLLHMKAYAKDYFIILLPIFLVGLYVFDLDLFNLDPEVFISFVVEFWAVINIYRLVILKENFNYYSFSKKYKIFIKYSFYSLLLVLIALTPLILSYGCFHLIESNNFSTNLNIFVIIIFVMLLIVGIILLIIVYPFLAIILPIIAIGKNAKLKNIWKLSKGFRLSLFLQIFILSLIPLSFYYLLYYFFEDNLSFHYKIIDQLISCLFYGLAASCLAKTYILWNEKNTNE